MSNMSPIPARALRPGNIVAWDVLDADLRVHIEHREVAAVTTPKGTGGPRYRIDFVGGKHIYLPPNTWVVVVTPDPTP
jgi:hypothetical protein